METEKRSTDAEEKMKDSTVNAIDELATAVKQTARKFFNSCVEQTAEVFSDVFDKYLDKTKEKINKKGETDE